MRSPAEGPPPSGLDLMPARRLPLAYFGFAHLCLAAAFAILALEPRGLGGFFYHPRMLAVVHLVTVGWISASILGSIYVMGPLALRLSLPARRLDYAAFVAFAVGVLGMASHFWLGRLIGMAWSGGLVTLALLHVALRVLRGLWAAPIPREVKLHVGLAFVNVLLAAVAGILLGVNKAEPFLPVSQLSAVFGHAHLAGLGWAVLMVMGAGYRLIPMILPAAMPSGAGLYASALLTEAGAVGLFVAFVLEEGRLLGPLAVLAAAGILVFLGQVVWMLRHPRPAPVERPRPDWSVAHALQALAYLGLSLGLGLVLAFAPRSEASFQAAAAYGVIGLVGFLAQIVVGVEGRLLPLFAWLWGFADSGFKENPPSLHRVPVRPLQVLIFFLWTVGVPALATGLVLDRPWLLAAGAGGLFVAVLCGAVNGAVVLRRLWRPLEGPPLLRNLAPEPAASRPPPASPA